MVGLRLACGQQRVTEVVTAVAREARQPPRSQACGPARRLRGGAKAVGERGAVREQRGEEDAGGELLEEVDAHNTADRGSANDDGLVARLVHCHHRGARRRRQLGAGQLADSRSLEGCSDREARGEDKEASHRLDCGSGRRAWAPSRRQANAGPPSRRQASATTPNDRASIGSYCFVCAGDPDQWDQ